MKSKIFFRFPFRAKRFFHLSALCLLALNVCLPLWANDHAQQETESPAQSVRRAEKLARKGNVAEAETILRRVTAENPKDFKTKSVLSYLLLRQRRLLEAYDLAAEIGAAEPKNARAFALVGTALLNFGNFRDARAVLGKAYQLDKEEPLAWYGAGMLDFYENRIADSVPKLLQAEYFAPNEADFIFSLAQVLGRAEKYSEAGDAYERFLRVSTIADDERRTRIKGLIAFLRYIGGKQKLYAIDKTMAQTTVPIDLVNMRPIVEVGVGGRREKFRFVLDTGSGITVISNETAERLKMKPIARGGMARAIGGDGKFEIVYGFLKSMEIGDARIKNVPVYIRQFRDEGGNIDGYIGLSLISKFLTTVDYGDLTFTLTRKNQLSTENFESEAIALPLRLTSSGFLSGEVNIDGVEAPLNFIVDTGASVSVISSQLASTDEISRFLIAEKMRVIGAAGVTENVDLFMLPRISFGAHAREKIKAIALNLDIINEASGFQQAGILGGNFLKNYRLTFDFQNSKVTFVPTDK